MAQRNDDELAFYLAQAVKASGQISDEDSAYLLAQLSPYTGASQINDLWRSFWVAAGIPNGQYNDMAYTWLTTQGIPAGSITDMWHDYFHVTYPAILDTAIADIDAANSLDDGVNVTGIINAGTGGAPYDLTNILGTNDLVRSTFNGRAIITSQGESGLSTAATQTIPSPMTIFSVHKIDNSTDAHYIYDQNGTSRVTQFYAAGALSMRFTAGVSANILTTSTAPVVSGAIANGADGRYELSGIQNIDPISTGSLDWDFGHFMVNQSGTAGIVGWVARVIVIPGALTTEEFDDMMNYLINYYGV